MSYPHVLISYGHSFPFIPDNEDSLEMAYDSAQLEAEAGIRSFAGESVSVFNSQDKSMNIQTLADNMEKIEYNEQRKKSIEAVSKSLKISGMRPLAKDRSDFHHLGIDAERIGPCLWRRMSKQIVEFVHKLENAPETCAPLRRSDSAE